VLARCRHAIASFRWARFRCDALLIARAENDAREIGLPEVWLYTNQAMTENQAVYPRLGYVETARGREDGYDRVFYVKAV
jgi:hypothetical protein